MICIKGRLYLNGISWSVMKLNEPYYILNEADNGYEDINPLTHYIIRIIQIMNVFFILSLI